MPTSDGYFKPSMKWHIGIISTACLHIVTDAVFSVSFLSKPNTTVPLKSLSILECLLVDY